MKNILSYYYSLHPSDVHHKDDKYFFEYFGNNYVFEVFKRPLNDIDALYKVNRQMLNKNLLVHEIILNNDNKILTYINNVPYILMEIFVNINAKISLSDVCYINNGSINAQCDKILSRDDWVSLWEIKNDYFESQINEIGKKYPNLCNYANYYIGLAENAISYVRNAMLINEPVTKSISHKRIYFNNTLYSLYNPTEMVYDYRIRDACEYIKSAFFNDCDVFELIDEYFKNNFLTYKEALLFYGRLLYPSYFFDMYDDIINNGLNEELIEKIIVKTKEYEIFLFNVHTFLTRMYNRYVPSVEWIIKRSLI